MTEQGNESLCSIQRTVRLKGSRKETLVKGDTDTVRHGFASSDPSIRALDRRPWCSTCNVDAHWTRGCKVRYKGPHDKEDESLVSSFFCTTATEPDDQKNLLDNL